MHGALTPHASLTLFKVKNDVHYFLHPARDLYDLFVIQVLFSLSRICSGTEREDEVDRNFMSAP
ncbi:hypothetical protein AXH09_19900 [Pseudomonas aeruginosa]|nr:hypothetical protein AXH09_19900 [Pseudomonas aeruginosa]